MRSARAPATRALLGYNGQADPLRTDEWTRSVRGDAVLTVPLFTGGLTSSRIRQQIERNNADRINVETARRSVMQSIAQNWNQLIATRANIASTTEQVRAARIAAEGTRQEQQVGLRTTLDVLNAEQELRSAELSQVGARHDEYVAAASVLAAMGRLEARNLAPDAPRYDPKTNFNKLRVTWGWVPWEEPLSTIDSALTPRGRELPLEGPVSRSAAPAAAPPAPIAPAAPAASAPAPPAAPRPAH